jgi:hypothetical protein
MDDFEHSFPVVPVEAIEVSDKGKPSVSLHDAPYVSFRHNVTKGPSFLAGIR